MSQHLELRQGPGKAVAWPSSLPSLFSRRGHGHDRLDACSSTLAGGYHEHVALAAVVIRINLFAFLESTADQTRQHFATAVLGRGSRARDSTGGLAGLGAGIDGKLPADASGVAFLFVLRLRLDA